MKKLKSAFGIILISLIFSKSYATPNPVFKYWTPAVNPTQSGDFMYFNLTGGNKAYLVKKSGSELTVMAAKNGIWSPIGQSYSGSDLWGVSIASNQYSTTSTPYIAQDLMTALLGGQITVKHVVNNKLIPVGTAVSSSAVLFQHGLAVSPSGIPYVFYIDDSDPNHPFSGHVKEFIHNQWVPVGQAINVNYEEPTKFVEGEDLSIQFTRSGTPYIYWQANNLLQVATLEKNKWVLLGNALQINVNGVSRNTLDVTIGNNGDIYAGNETSEIYDAGFSMQFPVLYVLKKDSSKWEAIKTFSHSPLMSNDFQVLSAAPNGTVYYTFAANHFKVKPSSNDWEKLALYTYAYKNGKWIFVGNKLYDDGPNAIDVSSTTDSQPILSYIDGTTYYTQKLSN